LSGAEVRWYAGYCYRIGIHGNQLRSIDCRCLKIGNGCHALTQASKRAGGSASNGWGIGVSREAASPCAATGADGQGNGLSNAYAVGSCDGLRNA